MLIAFEGQDGAGKTALLHAVHSELLSRGVAATAVDEFSSSPYGQSLIGALARDKFLRPKPDESTTLLTRALDIVADLYYLDERVIGPALECGDVVLKDRHVDTVYYTLVPALAQSGIIGNEERAQAWLRGLLGELRWYPAVTVYVDAPLDVRLRRIQQRQQPVAEARADEVSLDDLSVFSAREQVARRLISEEPARFVVIDNDRPLSKGVYEVLALIDAWRTDA